MITHSRAQRTASCGARAVREGLADALYVLSPALTQAFGLNYTQVGLIHAVHRAAASAFESRALDLADRFGASGPYAAGTACAGLGLLILGYASGFPAILAAVFLAGAGNAFQHPWAIAASSVHRAQCAKREAFAAHNWASAFGKLAVGGLCALLIAAGSAWQTPVMTLAVIALLAAALASIAPPCTNTRANPARARRTASRTARCAWDLRARSAFAPLGSIVVIDAMTRSGFLTFAAFLMLAKGVPEHWAILSASLVAAGGAAGQCARRRLAERCGPLPAFAVATIGSASGIAMVALLPGIPAYFLLPLVGLTLIGSQPELRRSVADRVGPEHAAQALERCRLLASAGMALSPLAYGILADCAGVRVAMLTAAGIATIALPLSLTLRVGPGRKNARA